MFLDPCLPCLRLVLSQRKSLWTFCLIWKILETGWKILFIQALPVEQAWLSQILEYYQSVFSDKPGPTDLVTHAIDPGDSPPVMSSPYRAIGSHTVQIEKEIQKMLELGIIEPSNSAWANPIVIVPKKNALGEILDEVRFGLQEAK